MIDLDKIQVTTIEEGHEVIRHIRAESKELLLQMQHPITNIEWTAKQDRLHKLRLARRDVQSKMGTIFKQSKRG